MDEVHRFGVVWRQRQTAKQTKKQKKAEPQLDSYIQYLNSILQTRDLSLEVVASYSACFI